MRFRFKSMLFFIIVLIVAVVVIGVGYFFWTEITSSTNVVVDGSITINYLEGNKFKFKDNAKISFSVTNNSSESLFYYVQMTDAYGDATYTITSDTGLEISRSLNSEIIFNQLSIEGNATHKWEIIFTNNSDKKYSGVLKVGTKLNESNTFSEVILSDNKVTDTSISNMGEEAKLDEGLISSKDDLGESYYFRGNVLNNNVEFANLNWKIVKINGDGSVKLVLSTLTGDLSKYYEEEYEFTKSTIYDYLNKWFDNNLKYYSDFIVYNKYCNDLLYEQDGKTFAAYNRINTNKIPNFICLGTMENLKIGLLTADEVMMAGAGFKENSDYYLNISDNDTYYWTMTSAVYKSSVYYPYIVSNKGALAHNVQGNLLRGVRPVINIIRNARVTGNGMIENPYKIVE